MPLALPRDESKGERSAPVSKVFYLAAAVLAWLPGAGAQARGHLQITRVPVEAPAALTPATSAALSEMTRRAGVVFAGRVQAVDRHDDAGFVEVRFAVDEAVKGCAAGRPYMLREWAGLWSFGTPRYVAGERLLVFLTGRSASGFSAPVDGFAGVLPLRATAIEPIADARGNAPPEDGSDVLAAAASGMPATGSTATGVGRVTPRTSAAAVPINSIAINSMAVDLRWLQATLERASGAYRLDSSRLDSSQAHSSQSGPVAEWAGPITPLAALPSAAGPPQTSVATVLALLRTAGAR